MTPRQDLIDYDFCEIPPASLAGTVFVDLNRNCVQEPNEVGLAGVTVELLNEQGAVIATTRTSATGDYRFEKLPPGEYAVRETQPSGYFHGGQRPGSGGGDGRVQDLLSQIEILGGENLTDYDFCEVPPAELSGYVFQDGAEIKTEDGLPPANLSQIRDGLRTPDDTPLPGVVLELRDGLTGVPIDANVALPGQYFAGADSGRHGRQWLLPLRRDSGRQLRRLRGAPGTIVDSRDTVGTTSGVAINPEDDIDPSYIEMLVDNPKNDAIIRIGLRPPRFPPTTTSAKCSWWRRPRRPRRLRRRTIRPPFLRPSDLPSTCLRSSASCPSSQATCR